MMKRYSFQNLINFTFSECFEKGLKFIGHNHKEPAIVGVPGVCKLFIVNWSKQIIKVDLWLSNDR
jgi:hypothetical protein